MTREADDIKVLVERLQPIWYQVSLKNADVVMKSANALTTLLSQVESLTLENQRLRVDAELMRQELKNIANADTIAWDDPTEYEAWAKNRARWALGKVEKS
jgi:hypothetical protein